MNVSRTVTRLDRGDDDGRSQTGRQHNPIVALSSGQRVDSRPLSNFRDATAFVLLGDPGSGKTTEFEAAAKSDACIYVTARHFLRSDMDREPKWSDKILFIDGLDEVRAGGGDWRAPLDEILGKLERMHAPRVRLSCRAAWLTANDLDQLRSLPAYEDLLLLHLDPLTEEDAKLILTNRGLPNADGFLATARDRNLHGLVGNPLTLRLLTDAVATDCAWPESRQDTFERACRALATERNDEHEVADRPTAVSINDKVAAAGHWATFLLLGKRDHISLGAISDSNAGAPLCLEDIPESAADRRAMTQALHTNLFSFDDRLEVLVPFHRSIAEYLAAKHLHERITDKPGVLASRVLTLLEGDDGIVVPSLRGLAAWLATLNCNVRRRLVEQLPLEVLISGDPTDFPRDHKLQLVKSLARLSRHRGPILRHVDPAIRSTLVNPDTIAFLRHHVANREPSDEIQSVVEFLFRGLASTPSPGHEFSVREAVAVARDDRWWFAARKQALAAAARIAKEGGESVSLIVDMLRDLNLGHVTDLNQELRGLLIRELYPQHLAPMALAEFVPATAGTIFQGHLCRALDKQTPDELVADVHDAFVTPNRRLVEAVDPATVLRLLDRGLQLHGRLVSVSRLYDWLSAHPEFGPAYGVDSPVQSWLIQHPDKRRALVREYVRRDLQLSSATQHGVDDIGNRYDFLRGHERVRGLLFLGLESNEAKRLCFDEALASASSPDVARRYLEMAVAGRRWRLAPNDWLKWALPQVHGEPVLVDILKQSAKYDEEQLQAVNTRLPRPNERFRRNARQRRTCLLENHIPPRLLQDLAAVYLGIPTLAPSLPRPIDRLKKWLARDPDDDTDDDAVDTALRVLCRVAEEDDIPSLADLLRMDEEGQVFPRAYPFLAGLAELGERDVATLLTFGDDRLRSALGTYYLTVLMDKNLPRWVEALLDDNPELVTEVFTAVHTARIRGRRRCEEHHLQQYASQYPPVATLAIPKLLAAFPTRARKWQAVQLGSVVDAGLRHLPKDHVLDVVRRKVDLTSMDTAQKAVWLGTGLRMWPRQFLKQSAEFVAAGRATRASRLADHCAGGTGNARFSPRCAGTGGACALIAMFGSRCTPDWLEGSGGYVVQRCIEYLSKEPKRSASRVLGLLLDDPALASWHDTLSRAREDQAELRREASFRHPSLEDIADVISGGRPANVNDLAEVVVDQLAILAREIRDGNADDWRLFWNEDSAGKPITPKSENSCRDALLGMLRLRLQPLYLDTQPEVHYADDTRTDIRVSGPSGTPAIPIEIKKADNRTLWSAIKKQLIQRYTRDPAAGGHGIYLALWFGTTCMVPRSGTRPKSPLELEERLRQQLSPKQRRLVRVVVLDISRPQGGASSPTPS